MTFELLVAAAGVVAGAIASVAGFGIDLAGSTMLVRE